MAEKDKLMESLKQLGIAERDELEACINSLLGVLHGFPVSGVRIDEAGEHGNETHCTLMYVFNDDHTETIININGNSTGVTLRCLCDYVSTGKCAGLCEDHKPNDELWVW